jgi:8-oxo-dGTP diphosphatase
MEFERPILTVDIAALVEGEDIVLIERGEPPFQGCLALPGGHFEVDADATLVAAAIREAEEEVSLKLRPEDLVFLTHLDAPGRDPRPGRRISVVFETHITRAVAGTLRARSDAKRIVIRPLASVTLDALAFDHAIVVRRLQFAYGKVRP